MFQISFSCYSAVTWRLQRVIVLKMSVYSTGMNENVATCMFGFECLSLHACPSVLRNTS